MGSHPRVVADKRATYDLFGPVNKLWSANYDRAMACFLVRVEVACTFMSSNDCISMPNS